MKIAPLHSRESDRISALRQTELLDSESELEFDQITKLAADICHTPMAIISLVDEKRQWFKSKVGLDAKETPRDFAFCSHTILNNHLMIVEDSHKDERFLDNPLVMGQPFIKFYAGAPLLDPASQLPLGTLCVIDQQTRCLTENQKMSLQILSNQISRLIDLKKKIKNIELQNQKLKYYQSALLNLQEGLVILSKNGNLIDFNTAAPRIFGFDYKNLDTKMFLDKFWNLKMPDGTKVPSEAHPARYVITSGIIQSHAIFRISTQDNKEKWISINSNPLYEAESKKPTHVVLVFSDITELQLAQEKLIENARLVSLAEMASGVGHEINNPLTIVNSLISNSLSLLEESVEPKMGVKKNLLKIKETVFRISKIVKGLKNIARDSKEDLTVDVILFDVVTDVLSVCSERFKQNMVNVVIDIDPQITVSANVVQLSQVILNLLVNSFDAISSLNIKWIRVSSMILEQKSQLIIEDSGPGIPMDVQKNMFFPFFTTKEVGKGTGLGLSISRSLIENMGGKLYYDNSHNNTCFIIDVIRQRLGHPSSPGILSPLYRL